MNTRAFKDISGVRFGKLIALSVHGRQGSGNIVWKCICDCGNEHLAQGSNLRSGNITSCGCLLRTDPKSVPNPPKGKRHIPLTRGLFAIIDESDFDLISGVAWHASKDGYAEGYVNGRKISMHRMINGAPVDIWVDHKDRNPLNNSRDNLRRATRQQNSFNRCKNAGNRSGYKGVTFRYGKWIARIRKDNILKELGRFDSPEKASAAYAEAAKAMFGEFACTA